MSISHDIEYIKYNDINYESTGMVHWLPRENRKFSKRCIKNDHWQSSRNIFISIKRDIPFHCLVSCDILMCHARHRAYNFHAYNDVRLTMYVAIGSANAWNELHDRRVRYNYSTGSKLPIYDWGESPRR